MIAVLEKRNLISDDLVKWQKLSVTDHKKMTVENGLSRFRQSVAEFTGIHLNYSALSTS